MGSGHDVTTTCGLFGWRPRWLQRFVTPKAFIALLSIIGLLGTIIFSYLTVVLSTIERRFGLQSKEMAWIYSGNEIAQISIFFILPFVGRVKRRPLWIGIFNVMASFGIFMVSLPHFFNEKYKPPEGGGDSVCQAEEPNADECDQAPKSVSSMVVMFLGIFVTGFANQMFYAFGLPYVDDNSKSEQSPLRMSFVMASRVSGPALGSILGAVFLKIYINIGEDPGFEEGHPSWLGAWWLGPLLISCGLILFGPLMTLFPGKMPNQAQKQQEHDTQPETAREWLDEFMVVVRRLASSKVYMLNMWSACTLLFGIIGFFQFFPKYLEYQFYQKASTSGSVGSVMNLALTAIGIVASGFVMSRWKFTARQITGYMCIVTALGLVMACGITFITCDRLEIHGLNETSCTAGCHCDNVEYQPLCSMDGVTNFISPCHAGCKSSSKSVEKDRKGRSKTLYWGCECAREISVSKGREVVKPWWAVEKEDDDGDGRPLVGEGATSNPEYTLETMVDGYCQTDCTKSFYMLLGTFAVFGIFAATTRLPGFVVNLRSVEKRDKAAALSLQIAVLSLFAFLPSPLIYGAIIDSTCTIWSVRCGVSRNCLAYDSDRMRFSIGGVVIVSILITLVLDIMTWYYAKDLQIYDEEDKDGLEHDGNGASKMNGHNGTDADSGFQEIELGEKAVTYAGH